MPAESLCPQRVYTRRESRTRGLPLGGHQLIPTGYAFPPLLLLERGNFWYLFPRFLVANCSSHHGDLEA